METFTAPGLSSNFKRGTITTRSDNLGGKLAMQMLSATYKGGRVVELFEAIALPRDIEVFVVIPEQGQDEMALRRQLQNAAETVFAKLWDNEADEVWNEYL
jgi:hypothetical protein